MHIINLINLAATKEYSSLFLDISQPKWLYDQALTDSGFLGKYIEILGEKITRLHICETAAIVWSWFTVVPNLRRLDFENVGHPGEEVLTQFWGALANLSLEDLKLSGINFPRSPKFRNWPFLRSLRLDQFGNVEATCSIVLQSFPNLRNVAFNNPNPSTTQTPVPIKLVACKNLRTLIFTRCQPQKNIVSLIAQSCPDIQVCMPPNNASDTDITTLIDSCPFLTTLLIDCCTDLTSTAIHYLPRAPRLRSLLYNFQHLLFLDEDCILALAENCPDLHSRGFRVATVGQKNDGIRRQSMRDVLPGNARYKRWLLRFAMPTGPHPLLHININIDAIRRELDGIQDD
jgi:hypothetical protein